MAGAAWRIVREQKGRTAVLALVALAGSAAELALPALLGRALDEALAAVRGGAPAIGRTALVCAGVVLLLAACDALVELFTGTGTALATARLRHRMLGRLLAAGPRMTRRFAEGDLVSRVVGNTSDAGVTPSAVALAAAGVVPPVGGLVALLVIDPWLGVAFAAGLPVLALLLRVFLRDTSDVVGRYLRVQGVIAARLVDALAGIRTITAAHAQERETRRVLGPLPELRSHGERTWRVQARVSAGATVLVPVLQAGVLAVAGYAVAAGRLSPGDLLAAGRYTVLAAGVGPVITQIGRLARARAATARTAEVLAEPVPEPGARTLPSGTGTLEFRAVTVPGALDEVTLTIPGGTYAAIVGPSGAGKSTLAALPGRLADPESGAVLLDGVPVTSLTEGALRGAVTYAFARPALLGDTPEDTITYGLPPGGPRTASPRAETEPSPAVPGPVPGSAPGPAGTKPSPGVPGPAPESGPDASGPAGAKPSPGVPGPAPESGPAAPGPAGAEPGPSPSPALEAARAAAADAFIERLPDGYRTPMDEVPLSGGEAQRLGLARAFVRCGRVLVLDDATSSLDTVTERRVVDVLTRGLAGRTRLIVARRAVTAARAGLVVWLDAGRLRGVGPHRTLWADPDYRAVFQTTAPVPEVTA